ncbi:GNAT family N-acetyltransferase [Actinopolymorpha sp. B9G3]|uniref:GNAT family N-acetyltransferase n=1 Tax=Actinopolymorpha sp. B9G3 TaxID=3158970 RepID=UPI0032D94AAB
MLVKLDQTHRELVHRIRSHAEGWLADKGTDQYRRGVNPEAVRRSIDHQIDTGAFVGWCVDGQIVAIVALIEADAELWTPQEVKEPQTYISRLLVAEHQHGKGYGAALLDAVGEQGRERGDRWIRLNCWTTNTRLHAYYEAHGFEHVRTVDIPGRMSGALFQRALRTGYSPRGGAR